ncbi:hypothetical protein F895_03082 [Acinetobacter sp. CIP 64.2]|nr:hypothetical protein F895_03082 [Acinetobacter sp. CIP 64.2]
MESLAFSQNKFSAQCKFLYFKPLKLSYINPKDLDLLKKEVNGYNNLGKV